MTCRPSEACSPGSAASTSASSEPAGPDAGKSSTNPSASESSPSTGPMFIELEMFTTPTEPTSAPRLWPTPQRFDATGLQRSDEALARAKKKGGARNLREEVVRGIVPTVSHPSTSSPAASHASPSASLDAVRSRTTIVGYGPSSPDAFASYDPDTSSWKTCQASFWGEEWTTYSEGWPTSGMTRSGKAFRRRPLVPRTSVTGSGSWPTPMAQMPGSGPDNSKVQNLLTGSRHSFYLTHAVEAERQQPGIITGREMWHTPTASDRDGRPRWDHRASPGYVRKKPVPNLMAQVLERWPTLTTRDWKDGQYNPNVPVNGLLGRAVWPTPRAQNGDSRNQTVWERPAGQPQNLENALATEDPTTVGGALSPTWVAWLMGFPLDWLEDLE